MLLLSFVILASIFIGMNSIILISDIRHQKIPNRALAGLLALVIPYYGYLAMTTGVGASLGMLALQVGLTLVVSFALYYYGVWSAGDAKYLLVLALFVLPSGIDNPVDAETVDTLRRAYDIVNAYHVAAETPDFTAIDTVKILRMFPFGGYLFAWFMMTYLWGELPFRVITDVFVAVFRVGR